MEQMSLICGTVTRFFITYFITTAVAVLVQKMTGDDRRFLFITKVQRTVHMHMQTQTESR